MSQPKGIRKTLKIYKGTASKIKQRERSIQIRLRSLKELRLKLMEINSEEQLKNYLIERQKGAYKDETNENNRNSFQIVEEFTKSQNCSLNERKDSIIQKESMKYQQKINNDLNKAPATSILNSQQSNSFAITSNQTPSFVQKQIYLPPEINFRKLIHLQEEKQIKNVQIIEQQRINNNIFIENFNTFSGQNDQIYLIDKSHQIGQIKDFYNFQSEIKESIMNEINNPALIIPQNILTYQFQQQINRLNVFPENNINQINVFEQNNNPSRYQFSIQQIPITQNNQNIHPLLQVQRQRNIDISKLKKNQKCSYLSSNNPQSAIMRIKLFEKQRKNSSDLQNN